MSIPSKSAFWIIFAVVFIDLIGFGIIFPLLPLYARALNISEVEIVWVIGIYSLMQFLFAPVLGALSDKVGRRPVLLISMVGTALSFFMLAWSKTFWWFLAARALDGIAGSNIATAQAYIADISPKEQRTRNLGMWIGAAFGLGFAFGPFIGGGLHALGQTVMPSQALSFPFLAAGVISLVNVAFAFFRLPESLPLKDSEHRVGHRTASWQAIRQRLQSSTGMLILTYALVIFAFAQMEATFSWLSADMFHLSSTAIYWIFGYLGVVMALVQGGLIRRLAPKLGDKRLALIGCLLMALSLGALPMFQSLAGLMAISGLLAVGHSFANPALISSISKGSSDLIQGETMGVTQSLASLSRFLGPLGAGYLYQHLGPVSPYWFASGLMVVALAMCWGGFSRLNRLLSPDEHPKQETLPA